MEKGEFWNQITTLWPIVIPLVSFVIYKLIPYLKTTIIRFRVDNTKLASDVFVYELFAELAVLLGGLFGTVIFGESTWENMFIQEYVRAWLVLSVVYLVGIFVICYREGERQKKNILYNILLGSIFNLMIFGQLYASLQDAYDENTDRIIYAFVFSILLVQVYVNLRLTIDKNATYVVFMNQGETYQTTHRPVKRGKDYYVTLINGKKKWKR